METQDPSVVEAVKASGESTLEKATAKAKKTFDQLLNVSLNIAVTGKTGSGKSSFVNALRGVSEDEDGAAPTGVTETTMDVTMYEHPTMPNVKIWDLPGIGSPNFKADKYLKDVKFKNYDFFIVLNSERFMQNDIMLAKEIKKQKKNFYFVRSKIDNDIRAEEKKKGFDEQKVLSTIREDCQKNLKELGDPKVFLISSFELDKYDFEMLQNTLEEELPEHKRHALLQAWPVCSTASLEKKIKMFEGMIWAASLASAGIAVIPVPGLSVACDAGIVLLFFTRCYYAFGLDDGSLSRLSEKLNKPLLEHLAKSKFASAIREKTVARIQVSASLATLSTVEYFASLLPVVGSAAAAGISFGTTYYLLREGLNELANIAREIRKEAELDTMMASASANSDMCGILTENSSSDMDLSGALQRLGENDSNAAVTKAKEQLDSLDSVTLNIAVTGETGAGKSAFINAFRGLGDEDDNSAPTGITETTKQMTMYTHPTKSNIKLWDLPGTGMPKFKANKFLKDVQFETYDLFIIISSERFKENDVFLAKEIQKKKKRFYFVRTKIDNDIRSVAQKINFNEQQVLCTIREDCNRNLKELGNPKVFLISSYDLGKYDFQCLVDTLEVDLPEQKRLALVQSLPVCSLAMLEKKKEALEKCIWLAALASGVGAFVPVPVLSLAIDKTVLASYLVGCHYSLGLNEKSLIQLSERMDKPVSQLQSAIRSPVTLAVVNTLGIRPRRSMTNPVKSLEDILDGKFIVNCFLNATEAFKMTYTVLSGTLNEMINDMRQVLQAAGLDE